jgi:hypothetical protein
VLQGIQKFDQWQAVLDYLQLDACTVPGAPFTFRQGWSAGGESEDHRRLKEFIARNPQVVGLSRRYGQGRTEFVLGSGDTVDILFRRGDVLVAVEVKSQRSDVADVMRGIHQCVK